MIEKHQLGHGPMRISLIGGCHADEPVGPALLRQVAARLQSLPPDDDLLTRFEWWIAPHVNPEGEARNAAWAEPLEERIDPVEYSRHVYREPPGRDMEFGFPRDADDTDARPENRELHEWWSTAEGPFHLHASLHGMAVAAGPWFLIESAWKDRSDHLQRRCRNEVSRMGYRLHDVDRKGDKGFWRIGPGFTTRPDSREMVKYFRERSDEATAALFRPSSMETIRSFGGDPLTLVSEMPLFLIPAPAGEEPSTSEEVGLWNRRFAEWQARLAAADLEDGRMRSGAEEELRREIRATGLEPMPVRDQMHLQWTFIEAGIEQVERCLV